MISKLPGPKRFSDQPSMKIEISTIKFPIPQYGLVIHITYNSITTIFTFKKNNNCILPTLDFPILLIVASYFSSSSFFPESMKGVYSRKNISPTDKKVLDENQD